MKYMKSLLLTVTLVVLSGCTTHLPSASFLGKERPYAQVIKLNGDRATLDEYDGKPLIIAFWSTWCGRSVRALEEINQFARLRNDISVLAVNLDAADRLEEVRKTIGEKRLAGIHHAFSGNEGDDDVYRAFKVDSFPVFIVINPQGVVLAATDSVGDVKQQLINMRR